MRAEEMRDFCCEAAPVAIMEGRDPVGVAQRHMALDRVPADRILHWWVHLRAGQVVEDGPPASQLWILAVGAYLSGMPPPTDLSPVT
jgi:hypothetical protein